MSERGPTTRPSDAPLDWPTQTHWSVVLAAGDSASPGALQALEELCRAYRYPVYVYVRRCGYAVADAQDLTQAFFLHLLDSKTLAAATPRRGRFRTFLLACLDHFIVSQWRRENALKRGGRVTFVSWEQDGAEQQYQQDAVCELTPERMFDQSWACALLDRVLGQLEQELAQHGKDRLFDEIKDCLLDGVEAGSYKAIAGKLGTTEAAVKMTVLRLRRRYGELLRREIAHTVASPDEVEGELRHLFAVVSA
jgi:RNA polymerase sigma-70 factor (ECF subfamily)